MGGQTMKKTFRSIILAVAVLLLATPSFAQQLNENRANSTKIVDALAKLPADKQKTWDSAISDIASTGQEGIDILMEMLAKSDESLVKVEYALAGLVNYVSAEGADAELAAAVKKTFTKALAKTKDETIKGFLVRQLMILGDQGSNTNSTVKSEQDAPIAVPTVKDFAKLLKDKKSDREARFDALNRIEDATLYYPAISKYLAKNADNDVAVDLLWWLGEQKDGSVADIILPFLNDEDSNVRSEAAWAITKIARPEDIAAVAALLSSENKSDVDLATACLKSYKGNVVDAATSLFDGASSAGKTGILALVAQRRSFANLDLVKKCLSDKDEDVKNAAFKTLPSIVKEGEADYLCSLLEKCGSANQKDVQNAILAAYAGKSKADTYDILQNKKNKVAPASQNLYWPMIIGSASADQLYDICAKNPSENVFNEAFNTLIKNINDSKEPGAQRLLRLRELMDLARNDAQRNSVLELVGKTDAFLGIIFAGQYLEAAGTQQAASDAIRKIGTAHPEFTGAEIVALLKRAAEVTSGQDAPYFKTQIADHLAKLPQEEGYVSMFNGKDLTGWKGLVENPIRRSVMKAKELAKAQAVADAKMAEDWTVANGCIEYVGKGFDNLCTAKQYGDFEMYVDWMLYPGEEPDAGIYLRGAPQVQIWDIARTNVGAEVGSGGLYNNQVNTSKPLCVADNAVGKWNSFYIKMTGERVTVYLNGVLVTDNVPMENYWDRSIPIFNKEQIELQAHGSHVAFRNLYIKELPQVEPMTLSKEEAAEGFELLFDGTNLHNFVGNKVSYVVEDGLIAVVPKEGSGGNLYTKDEYSDFVFRFEFKLTPGANNGIGIRCEADGSDAAYYGMEIQVLDHFNPIYTSWLKPYQHHGSVYGVIPAQIRTALNPVGEWNSEEIYAKGTHIKVTLNGIVITEGDIAEASKNGTETIDHLEHPGLLNKGGHIGFLGHGDRVWFRNVRVKKL